MTTVSIIPQIASAGEPEVPAAPDYAGFPAQSPALVKQMVGAAHRDIEKVRQLLADAPQLANAAIDWGFGDWETALGAASHTGRREIAAELLKHGARPDIFTAAMLGQLDVVKALIAANPGIQRLRGPHGLSLLHHARVGGEPATAVLEYLASLGDADPKYTDLPLTDQQRNTYTGEFSFGKRESERFTIVVPKQLAQLAIQPGGSSPRNLFHQGDHTFIPAGGNDVRIVFSVVDNRAAGLVVRSPKETLTATRC